MVRGQKKADTIGSEQALEIAHGLGEFSYHILARKTGILPVTVQDYIRRWEHSGLVKLVRKEGRSKFYMTADTYAKHAKAAPSSSEKPSKEGNMWRSMRHLRAFDATDLSAHSTAGGIVVTEGDAHAYCTRLMQAGYLRVVVKAVPKMRRARYALIDDTGPFAPKVKRVRAVYDPNRRDHVLLDGAIR